MMQDSKLESGEASDGDKTNREGDKPDRCAASCAAEKQFRKKLEEFMRTGQGKHMHAVYSVMMLSSTLIYVLISVIHNMDGIYEDVYFTWFEKGICVVFMVSWLLEFYIAPSVTGYLTNGEALQMLMIFVPVLAIQRPDPFETYVYVSLVISRVVRINLGSSIILQEIRSKEKLVDQQTFVFMEIMFVILKGLMAFTLVFASVENNWFIVTELNNCTGPGRPIDCPTYDTLVAELAQPCGEAITEEQC